MTESIDPNEHTPPRRPLLIAAVVGAVLVVALLVLLALTRNEDPEPDDGTGAGSSVPEETTTAPKDTPGSSGDDADPEATVATSVPLTPVSGSTESELCEAIVERIGQYRDVAADALPDEDLITALEEFEAQVDVQSDDQDWGDRIIEQLTNVRREWATARSAAQADDPDEAEARNDAAIRHLDRAIETADCPTA